MSNCFTFIESDLNEIRTALDSHRTSLSHPVDSYCEEKLVESRIYRILLFGAEIGYLGIIEDELRYFHVMPAYFKHAAEALSECIRQKEIRSIAVITQDSLLVSLIAEWDFTIQREACYFIDGGRQEKPQVEAAKAAFRTARIEDIPIIVRETGDFFDKLEERIKDETIFLLEYADSLMGCGIVERGKWFSDCVSIGMITCREHRQKGVAQTILWHLKEWVYSHRLRPVAGCWYYNVLSRRSLEAAGMIAASKGFHAVLLGKEELPLRTGNPPGELV